MRLIVADESVRLRIVIVYCTFSPGWTVLLLAVLWMANGGCGAATATGASAAAASMAAQPLRVRKAVRFMSCPFRVANDCANQLRGSHRVRREPGFSERLQTREWSGG